MGTKILISGCNGHMGKVVAQELENRKNAQVVAGIDLNAVPCKFPVYANPVNVAEKVDVIIDFSNPAALSSLLSYAKNKKIPVVFCTTGYSKEQEKEIKKASEEIPIFRSGNMSIGINLLIELAKKAAKILGTDFDVEIIEKHHNQKLDAPSGTALMIADGISSVRDETHYVFDRHSQRKKREKSEIGISSIRGGTIIGEHEVMFAGHHEVITLTHSAQSREIFAIGAINAACFLAGKPAGFYQMSDLLKEGGQF